MEKDMYGFCLSKALLSNHLTGTFTHVRAYESSPSGEQDCIKHAYPQLSGKELLATMSSSDRLLWRAEFVCLDSK